MKFQKLCTTLQFEIPAVISKENVRPQGWYGDTLKTSGLTVISKKEKKS